MKMNHEDNITICIKKKTISLLKHNNKLNRHEKMLKLYKPELYEWFQKIKALM